MDKDELIGRLIAIADTMAGQLIQVRQDLIDVEAKIQPYYRIITELVSDYKDIKKTDEGGQDV